MSEQQSDLGALVRGIRTAVSPFRNTLRDLHASHRTMDAGQVADYIPELATADPAWFGIAAAGARDGQTFEAGDSEQEFTIQSVSKPFVFGLALEDNGREAVAARVGVEPTGDAFNSIIRLDEGSHRPHNPMVNAGAIATAALDVLVDERGFGRSGQPVMSLQNIKAPPPGALPFLPALRPNRARRWRSGTRWRRRSRW